MKIGLQNDRKYFNKFNMINLIKNFSKILSICLLIVFCNTTFAQQIEKSYFKVGENDSLYYEAAGSGTTLIFIHDGLLNNEVWDNQFSFFSKNYRVIRYDRRGYGLSSDAKGEYSNMDDLLSLFTQLNVNSACLVACSSGGALAIDFTLEHSEKVEALVLVGAIVGGFSYTRHMLTRGGHLPKNFKNDMEENLYYASEDPYVIYYKNIIAKEKAIELVKKYPSRVYNRPKVEHHDVPAYKRLDEIKVPAIIIVGEFDIPDVHAHAGVINAGIVNSRRYVIPNAGHLAPFEQPDVFNQIMLNFLR